MICCQVESWSLFRGNFGLLCFSDCFALLTLTFKILEKNFRKEASSPLLFPQHWTDGQIGKEGRKV